MLSKLSHVGVEAFSVELVLEELEQRIVLDATVDQDQSVDPHVQTGGTSAGGTDGAAGDSQAATDDSGGEIFALAGMDDGAWHQLSDGNWYKYDAARNYGVWWSSITGSVYYDKADHQWLDANLAPLSMEGTAEVYVYDGRWHDLRATDGYWFLYDGTWEKYWFSANNQWWWNHTNGTWWWYYNGAWSKVATGASAEFIFDGDVHQVGTIDGHAVTCHYRNNIAYWDYDGVSGDDVYYNYNTGQWRDVGGWALSQTGASAGFIYDGLEHALGNGFSFTYYGDAAEPYGLWTGLLSGHNYQFQYEYQSGQWSMSRDGGAAIEIGEPGRSVEFLFDGVWHSFADGDWYRFDGARGYGVWWSSITGNSLYDYQRGQWFDASLRPLSMQGEAEVYIYDGAWHDLTATAGYRFSYDGTWEQYWFSANNQWWWNHTNGNWWWYYNGAWSKVATGASAEFIYDGDVHNLGADGNFRFDAASNVGYWDKDADGVYELRFNYGNNTWQWFDFVDDQLWEPYKTWFAGAGEWAGWQVYNDYDRTYYGEYLYQDHSTLAWYWKDTQGNWSQRLDPDFTYYYDGVLYWDFGQSTFVSYSYDMSHWTQYKDGPVMFQAGGAAQIQASDDGGTWFLLNGAVRFMDNEFASTGWHDGRGFDPDLYDGIGWDGEPVHYTYDYFASDDYWKFTLIGDWTGKTLATYFVETPVNFDYGVWSSSDATDIDLYFVFDGNDHNWDWYYLRDIAIDNTRFVWYNEDTFDVDLWSYYTRLIAYAEDAPIDTLAITQHGNANNFWVGVDCITSWNIANYRTPLQELGEALADDAQIQVWECSVAASGNGDARGMLRTLAQYTGATVFASTDLTVIVPSDGWYRGNDADWVLEFGTTAAGQVDWDSIDWIWDLDKMNWDYFDVGPRWRESV
jgi:hypothetical protein